MTTMTDEQRKALRTAMEERKKIPARERLAMDVEYSPLASAVLGALFTFRYEDEYMNEDIIDNK